MRRVIPYRTKQGALNALDNGGRFYNLFTRAHDGEITAAELARVAGVLLDSQMMFLFFDMALAELAPEKSSFVRSALSASLKKSYRHYAPAHFTVADARQHARPGQSAIIIGIPRYVDSRRRFTGHMMMPIKIGETTTMIPVPMTEYYDVYELRDEATDADFLIAHARGQRTLLNIRTRLGGLIKELQNEEGRETGENFLDTSYYSHV